MNEQELSDLLDAIRGEGRFKLFGPGMHIYPGRYSNEDSIYCACLELEARGLVERRVDSLGHVSWTAAKTMLSARSSPATPASLIAMAAGRAGEITSAEIVKINKHPEECIASCEKQIERCKKVRK